jgi:hypothetical protein
MEHLTEQQATEFFSEFYFGEHHIPGYKPKRCGFGWSVNHDRGELATFDYNQLTRLVFMAHDKCIRVGVEALRNGIIRITIWQRQREGTIDSRHPTLEQALAKFRNEEPALTSDKA